MKKMWLALGASMATLAGVALGACTSSTETGAPPVTVPVTTMVTVTATVTSKPSVPDEEVAAAWAVRREAITALAATNPTSAASVRRDDQGKVVHVFVADKDIARNNVNVFFADGRVESVIYVVQGREHSTWLCEFVSNRDTVVCPGTEEESSKMFKQALLVFDQYAKGVFGNKYHV